MKVIFMRHGMTNYNDLGLCNDSPADPVTLSMEGERQATVAARRLAHTPIQRIFVSELPRTRQTAEIVNQFHGVEIIVHPALNDIRSGFNGRRVTDYQMAIAHDRLNARVNGGESLLDHKLRVLTFLESLDRYRDESVLVIAHEESLRVFYGAANGLPDEEMINLSFANCECFEVTL